jgi:hypothetical protein
MNTNLTSMQGIINEVTAIETPKDLVNYKNVVLEQFKDIESGINSYIIGVKNNNLENLNNAQTMFSKNTNEGIRKREELMKVFDKYKINYDVQADGTLRFWYKASKGI